MSCYVVVVRANFFAALPSVERANLKLVSILSIQTTEVKILPALPIVVREDGTMVSLLPCPPTRVQLPHSREFKKSGGNLKLIKWRGGRVQPLLVSLETITGLLILV